MKRDCKLAMTLPRGDYCIMPKSAIEHDEKKDWISPKCTTPRRYGSSIASISAGPQWSLLWLCYSKNKTVDHEMRTSERPHSMAWLSLLNTFDMQTRLFLALFHRQLEMRSSIICRVFIDPLSSDVCNQGKHFHRGIAPLNSVLFRGYLVQFSRRFSS